MIITIGFGLIAYLGIGVGVTAWAERYNNDIHLGEYEMHVGTRLTCIAAWPMIVPMALLSIHDRIRAGRGR